MTDDASDWVPQGAGPEELAAAAAGCPGCELGQPATQGVVGDGPAAARMMLVGEQPGDQEDRQGEPFVGPAGRVLDDALDEAGIDRGQVWLTNAVKHFRHEQRGKRRIHQTPELRHLVACHPWLDAELAAIDPEVVVALGATAGRAVLGRPVKVGAERGRPLKGPGGRRTVLTTHPSALLRLRRHGGFDEAFAALVDDLRTASG